MILARAPFRVSFVGGGSDIPSFYQYAQGCIVGCATDLWMYVAVHETFDGRWRAVYSSVEDVRHPHEFEHELIRESLLEMKVSRGVEISSMADVPRGGTGLGSSSAYTVALLTALTDMQGRPMPARAVANMACRVEIARCRRPIGKQDQYLSALGGLQALRFATDGRVMAERLDVPDWLGPSLQLFHLGEEQRCNPVLTRQAKSMQSKPGRAIMKQMVDIAFRTADAFRRDAMGLAEFGEVLQDNWQLKRRVAEGITSEAIDNALEAAVDAGAYGGKLLGAGGRGFLLICSPPERHDDIRTALSGLRDVPFRISETGAEVVYDNTRRP